VLRGNPGTYLLLIRLPELSHLKIGRTRFMNFDPGSYCYAGSALGPGGLAARLRRHAAGGGRKHWHIDYLLPHGRLVGALVLEDTSRLECAWASWVGRVANACIDGFGASDCKCNGHLFHLGARLEEFRFVKLAQQDLHARPISKNELNGSHGD
jgi:Uri superfamily endonuclease